MTKIAGIDYSLTSPAICIWKEADDNRLFDFDSCNVYYLENTSRPATHGVLNIHGESYPEWNSEEERHDKLSDWTMSIIKGCDNIFIEGYAFATSGKSHVRSVAENTGLLKHKMYKVKLKYTSVPPSVIKKYATGKGNANKELMYDAFNAELVTPPDLQLRFKPKSKKLSNPVTDIVDSYFIAKWGWEGFAS